MIEEGKPAPNFELQPLRKRDMKMPPIGTSKTAKRPLRPRKQQGSAGRCRTAGTPLQRLAA